MPSNGPRRVLLLAYHFPPVGGAGAQRALHLVRHLAERGVEPVVVTCPGDREGRYNPRDEDLAAALPDGVRVLRVPGPEPDIVHGDGWRSRAERLSGRIDARTRWWMRGALATGLRAGEVDLVHAFLEPYETAFPAARLAERLGVPWVADLQDPWALDEVRVHITALHLLQDRRRMWRGLRSAAAVVMNTEEAARAVRAAFPRLRDRPVVAVPNGFDASEWTAPAPDAAGSGFRIVHTGTLHTEMGLAHRRSAGARRLLGGGVAPVDMLTRSHVFLLDALAGLLEREPALAGRVEVLLAGVLSPADLDVASRHPFVRPLGFLSHADTVGLIRSADLLFLPMHDLPPGRRARIVPCKTYEYLASGRPVLAAVPDGDARDLLAAEPEVYLCRPGDVQTMRETLASVIERAPVPAVPRLARLRRFERASLAEELLDLHRSLAPGDRRPAPARPRREPTDVPAT